jgi:hypothetical protein
MLSAWYLIWPQSLHSAGCSAITAGMHLGSVGEWTFPAPFLVRKSKVFVRQHVVSDIVQ